MSKFLILTFSLFIILIPSAHSNDRNFGVGLILGAPTGFAVNYLLGEDRSLYGQAAWDLGSKEEFQISSFYQKRLPRSIHLEDFDLGWYFGAGGRIKFTEEEKARGHDDDDVFLGPGVNIGLFHTFEGVPIEVYLTAGLIVDIIPSTDADLDAGIGGIFYF